MYSLLGKLKQGAPWREVATSLYGGQGSLGNGAAMRVPPVGAYFADDIAKVVEQAKLSAVVTHTHPEAVAGAVAVAVAAALAYRARASGALPSFQEFFAGVLAHVPAG